ncbi:S24/S26 family peptidase [Methanobacterium oryzae]|uniref:S24/S26 family peptidase n=1 Tax=Methanobacterium oryzae TaxID=69540 RepID=UPI003D19707D
MKSRSWLIIGIIIIGIIAASGFILTQENSVEITLETNGTTVDIQPSSLFSIPPQMEAEMQEKALIDVQDPDSTVESVKRDIKAIAKKYNYTADVTIKSQFGTDQLPMPATVSGTSMVPTLEDGQEIIVLKTDDYKVNDIVVATHPEYGMIVKRLKKIEGNKVYLMSDNRKVEVYTTETALGNGMVEVETIKKTPLDTWLPKENIIGVVKEY